MLLVRYAGKIAFSAGKSPVLIGAMCWPTVGVLVIADSASAGGRGGPNYEKHADIMLKCSLTLGIREGGP